MVQSIPLSVGDAPKKVSQTMISSELEEKLESVDFTKLKKLQF